MSEDNTASSGTSRPHLKPKCMNSDADSNSLPVTSPKQPPKDKQLLPKKRKNLEEVTTKPSKQMCQIASNMEEDKENDGKKDMLTYLPSEILEKIFNQVSFNDLFRIEKVNKHLRKVVMNVVWPKKEVFDRETVIKHTKLKDLNLEQEKVKTLTDLNGITNTSVELILSRANIKYLDVSMYYRKVGASICSMLNMAPQLISLNLSKINLTKASLNHIARLCPNLEQLIIKDIKTDRITKSEVEKGLKNVFIKCKNLKYLDISGNCDLKGESFEYVPSQLLYLNIAACFHVTSQAMCILSEKAKNLKTLVLEFYTDPTDLDQWLKKFTKLQFIEFTLHQLFYPSLINLSNLENLEMVTLEISFSTQTLEYLQYCPKLKALNLKNIHHEKHDWKREFEILKTLKSLKYLKLVNFCGLEGLIDFVQYSQIQYLFLDECDDVSDKIIKELITECNSLTHFELHHEHKNYNNLLMEILPEENSSHSNILKLVIDKKGVQEIPPCKWCEVIISNEDEEESPFDHFTNVRKQYSKQ